METISKSNNMKQVLLEEATPRAACSGNKITIVGAGMVGMACAFSILTQNVSSDIALIDAAENTLMGEMLDLQHGSQFLRDATIKASTDYAISADSNICIITAGVRQKEGESRLDLVQRNANIMKQIVPKLIAYSPNTILLIVTNPVDILTYIVWKISGFPKNRVIGSGTNLDSSRLRFLMSQKLEIASSSCYGWIIGEHGDSSVVVWSSLNVAGISLQKLNPNIGTANDPENWGELHRKVINSGYDIIKLKGYTSWAIGLSVSDLAGIILNNTANVRTVSVHAMGFHGITQDVFLSLPAILGRHGVSDVVKQQLNNEEILSLQNSAKIINEVQRNLK